MIKRLMCVIKNSIKVAGRCELYGLLWLKRAGLTSEGQSPEKTVSSDPGYRALAPCSISAGPEVGGNQ